MPLVRNTANTDGTLRNNHLEKINTGGDACGRTAIRSYYKYEVSSSITEIDLPWVFEPGSHTLWVFVNGQKAEYKPSGGSTVEQLLEYMEQSNNRTVEFYYPLIDGDIVEFIVAGNYEGEEGGALIPDLSMFKTTYGIDIGEGPPQNFETNQPMGGYKFTGLPAGTDPQDSVNVSQLGSQVTPGGEHYHSYLWNTGKTGQPVISTANGLVDIVGDHGQVNLWGTSPEIFFHDSDNDGARLHQNNGVFYFQGRNGTTGSFFNITTTDITTKAMTFYGNPVIYSTSPSINFNESDNALGNYNIYVNNSNFFIQKSGEANNYAVMNSAGRMKFISDGVGTGVPETNHDPVNGDDLCRKSYVDVKTVTDTGPGWLSGDTMYNPTGTVTFYGKKFPGGFMLYYFWTGFPNKFVTPGSPGPYPWNYLDYNIPNLGQTQFHNVFISHGIGLSWQSGYSPAYFPVFKIEPRSLTQLRLMPYFADDNPANPMIIGTHVMLMCSY